MIVFVKPNCPQCDMTKRVLDREGVEYEPRDVTTDAQALATVQDLGYLAAPVVVTPEGQSWSGFKPDLIKEYANAASLRM